MLKKNYTNEQHPWYHPITAQMRLRLDPAQLSHSRASMPGPEWAALLGRWVYMVPVTLQVPLLR